MTKYKLDYTGNVFISVLPYAIQGYKSYNRIFISLMFFFMVSDTDIDMNGG